MKNGGKARWPVWLEWMNGERGRHDFREAQGSGSWRLTDRPANRFWLLVWGTQEAISKVLNSIDDIVTKHLLNMSSDKYLLNAYMKCLLCDWKNKYHWITCISTQRVPGWHVSIFAQRRGISSHWKNNYLPAYPLSFQTEGGYLW
jgi:hypothetical protein